MDLFKHYNPIRGTLTQKNKLEKKMIKQWHSQQNHINWIHFMQITFAVAFLLLIGVIGRNSLHSSSHNQGQITSKNSITSTHLTFTGKSKHFAATNTVYRSDFPSSENGSNQFTEGVFELKYIGDSPDQVKNATITIKGPHLGETLNNVRYKKGNTYLFHTNKAFANYTTDVIHIKITWNAHTESFDLKNNKNDYTNSKLPAVPSLSKVKQTGKMGFAIAKNNQFILGASYNSWAYLLKAIQNNFKLYYNKPVAPLLATIPNHSTMMVMSFPNINSLNGVNIRVIHTSGETKVLTIHSHDPVLKNLFGYNQKNVIKFIDFDQEGVWTLSAEKNGKILGKVKIRTYFSPVAESDVKMTKQKRQWITHNIQANWLTSSNDPQLILQSDKNGIAHMTFNSVIRFKDHPFSKFTLIATPDDGGKSLVKVVPINKSMLKNNRYEIPVTLHMPNGTWRLIEMWDNIVITESKFKVQKASS